MRYARSFGQVSEAERRQAWRFWADFAGVPEPAAEDAENWIPEPSFPKRASSLTGEAFIKSIAGYKMRADWQKREDAMVEQLLAGNIPSWLQQWITVRVSLNDASPDVKVRVLPDYLCVGTDDNYRHLPLDQQSAQRVADAFTAILPTAKICHAIWRRTPWERAIGAITLPTIRKRAGRNFAQDSTEAFDAHSLAIQDEMKRKGITPGQLVAGHKKDVVLAAKGKSMPEKISFHGFYIGKYPAEPCYDAGNSPGPSCNREMPTTTHPEGLGHFSDYSQGVRLVHPQMTIDGAMHLVSDVLKDQKLSTLIAEAMIDPPRVPPYPKKK
jgi:hypothetical protein